MMNEFELIQRYFIAAKQSNSNIILNIGDDAAIVRPNVNEDYVLTLDNLVENIHFLPDMPAHALGYKLLAVNLSDLSAMGAKPRYALLSLTLPNVAEIWLQDFSKGLFNLLDTFQIDLIGGNTTQGPLNLGLQLTGTVPQDMALTRKNAKVGDKIYVSGILGAASFALHLHKTAQNHPHYKTLITHFYYPKPRVQLGMQLRKLAHSAIDISDGLLADLNHLLQASSVGAKIDLEKIPLFSGWENLMTFTEAIQWALTGGDDYELCFTIPAAREIELTMLSRELAIPCTCIGEITNHPDLQLFYQQTAFPLPEKFGYEHFQQ
jgi:thiamine-monophosphate kinase